MLKFNLNLNQIRKVRYSAVQHSTLQYSTVQYSTVKHKADITFYSLDTFLK